MKPSANFYGPPCLFSCFLPAFGRAYAAQYNLDFEETAESVYMVNLDTDTVVFEKNADERRSPASITKIIQWHWRWRCARILPIPM